MKSLGNYFIFLHSMLVNREAFKVYVQQTLDECIAIGISSVPIVIIVSVFMGAVTSIQVAANLVSPLIGKFIVGVIVRDMTILELSPTVMAIIFAGKVGSNIAGQLGSMRISEQIDALEIIGINATSYLVLPKILASLLMYPLLVIISGFLCIYSGFLANTFVLSIAPEDYIYGIRFLFDPYTIRFAIYKSFAFAFLISSISSYQGFYIAGGALAVGQASTRAVINSCIAILVADYALAQLLLNTSSSS